MNELQKIRTKYKILKTTLNERSRRMWAVSESKSLGYGGVSLVVKATGISRSTIMRGLREISSSKISLTSGRLRRMGAGRKKAVSVNPKILEELEFLVEPNSSGDPQSALRWTSKSTRRLSDELNAKGYENSQWLVRKMLDELGYRLQSNAKSKEGKDHPDRDAQFQYIHSKVAGWIKQGDPVISVDTKKKENIGNFKNQGREWRPKGDPEQVRVHDFIDPVLGKAIPYGVYDLAKNKGWVSVGIDHDTSSFAVNSIKNWWQLLGLKIYPQSKKLFIISDSGGSNGSRVRLWKWELQKLAIFTGMEIHVSHLPPGTSKWNKIEHRLFSFISKNWRGRPLRDLATVVKLISNTTTATGLKVYCRIDRKKYPTKVKVSDEQMNEINMKPDTFHGEWNYIIKPK